MADDSNLRVSFPSGQPHEIPGEQFQRLGYWIADISSAAGAVSTEPNGFTRDEIIGLVEDILRSAVQAWNAMGLEIDTLWQAADSITNKLSELNDFSRVSNLPRD